MLVVEFMDKVLQMVDCDLQAALLRELAANKVDLMLKTAIKSIKRGEGATRGHPVLLVELEGQDKPYVCDCFLSATGRCGQVEGLNLEAVGVQLGRGQMIQVDENQHTGVGQIYAVGDCAGGNLATLGQAQAVRAVRRRGCKKKMLRRLDFARFLWLASFLFMEKWDGMGFLSLGRKMFGSGQYTLKDKEVRAFPSLS